MMNGEAPAKPAPRDHDADDCGNHHDRLADGVALDRGGAEPQDRDAELRNVGCTGSAPWLTASALDLRLAMVQPFAMRQGRPRGRRAGQQVSARDRGRTQCAGGVPTAERPALACNDSHPGTASATPAHRRAHHGRSQSTTEDRASPPSSEPGALDMIGGVFKLSSRKWDLDRAGQLQRCRRGRGCHSRQHTRETRYRV